MGNADERDLLGFIHASWSTRTALVERLCAAHICLQATQMSVES